MFMNYMFLLPNLLLKINIHECNLIRNETRNHVLINYYWHQRLQITCTVSMYINYMYE